VEKFPSLKCIHKQHFVLQEISSKTQFIGGFLLITKINYTSYLIALILNYVHEDQQ